MSQRDNIIQKVNGYYTAKIKQHGATPQGVDWNGEESQFLRFDQLSKNLLLETGKASVLDYGCGYGSLLKFLKNHRLEFDYTGFDISDSMLAEAARAFPSKQFTWINKLQPTQKFDYVLLSGIFNVKLESPEPEWVNYVIQTLDTVNTITRKEFSFNILTSYSDKEYMRDDLYYANPEFWFSHCKNKYSKKVILNHGYPLYEFTIHVIK